MTKKHGFVKSIKVSARRVAIVFMLYSATIDTIHAQSSTQPHAPVNSTLAPSTAASAPQQSASPVTSKEIKETKEIKEIREHPSDWVGTINSWPLAAVLMLVILLLSVAWSSNIRESFVRSSKLVRTFKIGGVVELELDIAALTEGSEKTIEAVEAQIVKVNQIYERAAASEELSGHLSDVMLKALPRVLACTRFG